MQEQQVYYRLFFYHQNEIYQIYAQNVCQQEEFFGFLQAENLSFHSGQSQLVVDPSEERLRNEFDGVNRIYIPIQSVIRIDEMNQKGPCKITPIHSHQPNNN
jgi:hypothetical protein